MHVNWCAFFFVQVFTCENWKTCKNFVNRTHNITRKSWQNQQKINKSMLIRAMQWPISLIFELFVKINNLLPIFLLIWIVQWPNQQNFSKCGIFWDFFKNIVEFFGILYNFLIFCNLWTCKCMDVDIITNL